MGVFYLFAIIFGIAIQSVFKKSYSKKQRGGVFTFAMITVITACLFFVVSGGFKFNFNPEILPYAIGFAAAYCAATIFGFWAILTGPLSLTSLATSYSLLIPTFWGIIFDGDKTSVWLYVGIALLAASLVFINMKDKKPTENASEGAAAAPEARITVKWVIFVLIALVTNGACSTIQPAQTKKFDGAYDSIFMIISLAIVAVVLLCFVLWKERGELVPTLKVGTPYMVLCGIANGVVNLFVMLASMTIPKSVMFPLISAGGIVLTWIISVFLYKEKLSTKQNIGLVLGIISIVFLNL